MELQSVQHRLDAGILNVTFYFYAQVDTCGLVAAEIVPGVAVAVVPLQKLLPAHGDKVIGVFLHQGIGVISPAIEILPIFAGVVLIGVDADRKLVVAVLVQDRQIHDTGCIIVCCVVSLIDPAVPGRIRDCKFDRFNRGHVCAGGRLSCAGGGSGLRRRTGRGRVFFSAGAEAQKHPQRQQEGNHFFHGGSPFKISVVQPFTEPPQYSQQPDASGLVVAPHQGQVTACLGAAAALASFRTC